MTITIGGSKPGTVRAIALVGFYRGDLVEPGQIIDLPGSEFNELRGMHKVDFAPAESPPAPPPEKGKPK